MRERIRVRDYCNILGGGGSRAPDYDIFTDAQDIVGANRWDDQGTLTLETDGGYEGNNYYKFAYAPVNPGYYAVCGLNISGYGATPVDFTGHCYLIVALKHPDHSNAWGQFIIRDTSNDIYTYNFFISPGYVLYRMPLAEAASSVTLNSMAELNVQILSVDAAITGDVEIDNIVLTNTKQGYHSDIELWSKFESDADIAANIVGDTMSKAAAQGSWNDDGYFNKCWLTGYFSGATYNNQFGAALQTDNGVYLAEAGSIGMWIGPQYAWDGGGATFDRLSLFGETTSGAGTCWLGYNNADHTFQGRGPFIPVGGVNCVSEALTSVTGFSQWEFFHIAITWDTSGIDGSSNTMRIYYNNTLIGTSDAAVDTLYLGYKVLKIGNIVYGQYRTSPGRQDNLKVWYYAKTDFSDITTEAPV